MEAVEISSASIMSRGLHKRESIILERKMTILGFASGLIQDTEIGNDGADAVRQPQLVLPVEWARRIVPSLPEQARDVLPCRLGEHQSTHEFRHHESLQGSSETEGEVVTDSTAKLRYTAFKRVLEDDTKMLSFLDQICEHPAYASIVGLGQEALPFILEDLKKGIDQDGFPGVWFMQALPQISRENPDMGADVLHEDGFAKVSVEGVALRWIDWGRKKGLVA
jgi:hypothetical protein